MAKRNDEEMAKNEFSHFLSHQLGLNDYAWHDVPQKEEPPDYILLMGGKTYSVEITSVMEIFELGKAKLSSIAISSYISKFVETIERIAVEQGILSGTYAVTMSPFKELSIQKDSLLIALLDYISSTKALISAPEKVVFEEADMFCAVQKLGASRNLVCEVIDYPAKWEGESEHDLEILLGETLSVKKKKLSKIESPIILLIIDSFNYLHASHWGKIIAKLEDKNAFHTIFRVSPSTSSSIIFSCNEVWRSYT